MIKLHLVFFAVVLPIIASAQFLDSKPPIAEIKTHWRVFHNDSVADPYFWMYDYFGNGPDSILVVENLKAENNYLEKVMSNTATFQNQLFNEMKTRIKEKDEDVHVYKNGYYY